MACRDGAGGRVMDFTQVIVLFLFYACSLLGLGAILPANAVVGGSHPVHSTYSHPAGLGPVQAGALRMPARRHDRIFKRESYTGTASSSSSSSSSQESRRVFKLLKELIPGRDSVHRSSNNACTTFNYSLPDRTHSGFSSQLQSAVKLANILNNLFLDVNYSHVNYSHAYYYALVKGMVVSDDLIYGSAIAFGPQGRDVAFCPYVRRTRDSSRLNVTDLGENLHREELKEYYAWFWKQHQEHFSLTYNQHNICKKSENAAEASRVGGVDTLAVNMTNLEQGIWSPPHDGCSGGDHWVVTFSLPFFGCSAGRGEHDPHFKGVVAVDIDVAKVDINQCDDGDRKDLFAGTHRCPTTTECVHVSGQGFRRGGYKCKCKPDYYFPGNLNSNSHTFNGSELETRHGEKPMNISQKYQCLPCSGSGCSNCNDTPCFAEYDVMMRGIPLGVQSFCMTISLVLAFVLLRLRKSKVMKASMWMVLEVILGGALLLYSTVVIQYFKPGNNTCILIPWFREVGFAVVYGALILKVYRVLAEFQSRKAHRVHVRDKDLLKYLCCIVLVVIGYMAAWTAVNMDHISEGHSMLDKGTTPEGLPYNICKAHWWDYVIEVGEFLFLCFGIYLCYCIRAAPSDYLEARYVSWAIYNETIASALLHVTRHFLWLQIHPDYIFLMYFLRCQLTVTTTLILVLGPKLWYAHRPPEDDHFRGRTYSTSDVHDSILPESMKLHVGVNSNGDVDVEINLSEMDPEDIRGELKRLYTQLQIYKTKTMRKDNPHISKRRGGRKQTHRRFSLQAFHHKHRHHHSSSDHDHEHEMSKTPEESTNSAEGVAISMAEESSIGEMRTPTVTFKPGHKSMY